MYKCQSCANTDIGTQCRYRYQNHGTDAGERKKKLKNKVFKMLTILTFMEKLIKNLDPNFMLCINFIL